MKEMLVDAICGAGVPRVMTRGERAPLVTKAWGEHRTWKRPALLDMPEEALQALYEEIKDHYGASRQETK